jgi:hypothetical protein
LDRTIWGGKFDAIVESEKYDTLTVNELFSKLKSAEVDRGMTAKLEGPTDSHSLALVGGLQGNANTNPSTRMFSLSSLMSMPDEEFDVLEEDELALVTRRFERLHEPSEHEEEHEDMLQVWHWKHVLVFLLMFTWFLCSLSNCLVSSASSSSPSTSNSSSTIDTKEGKENILVDGLVLVFPFGPPMRERL